MITYTFSKEYRKTRIFSLIFMVSSSFLVSLVFFSNDISKRRKKKRIQPLKTSRLSVPSIGDGKFVNRSIRIDQQDVVVEVADQGRANPICPFRDKVVQGRPTFHSDIHRADRLPISLADLPCVLDERAELRFRRRGVDGSETWPYVAQQPIELPAAESAPQYIDRVQITAPLQYADQVARA